MPEAPNPGGGGAAFTWAPHLLLSNLNQKPAQTQMEILAVVCLDMCYISSWDFFKSTRPEISQGEVGAWGCNCHL